MKVDALNSTALQQQATKKNVHGVQRKTVIRLILWGLCSLALYLVIFLNQAIVTEYFTKGGVFTAVVIFTAIAFSLIHGNFAGLLLELIGIKPLQQHKD